MGTRNKVSNIFNMIVVKGVAALLVTLFLLTLLSGCGEGEKTVKSEDMTIKLGKEYKESTLANATWYYTSPDGLAMGIRSMKDDIEKSGLEVGSAHDYAEDYIKANNIPGNPTVKTKDNYVYFEYKRKVSGTEYAYLSCIYEHEDEYWLVNFACYKELYKEYKEDFFASADSVSFKEED